MQPQVMMEKLAFGTLGMAPQRGPGMAAPGATAAQAIRRPAMRMPAKPTAPRAPSVTASATAATSAMQPRPKSATHSGCGSAPRYSGSRKLMRKKEAFAALSKMVGGAGRMGMGQMRRAAPAVARQGMKTMSGMGMGQPAAGTPTPQTATAAPAAQKSAAALWAAAFADEMVNRVLRESQPK